jgi:hypothetical protein
LLIFCWPFADLLNRMFTSQDRRISVREILNHPWICTAVDADDADEDFGVSLALGATSAASPNEMEAVSGSTPVTASVHGSPSSQPQQQHHHQQQQQEQQPQPQPQQFHSDIASSASASAHVSEQQRQLMIHSIDQQQRHFEQLERHERQQRQQQIAQLWLDRLLYLCGEFPFSPHASATAAMSRFAFAQASHLASASLASAASPPRRRKQPVRISNHVIQSGDRDNNHAGSSSSSSSIPFASSAPTAAAVSVHRTALAVAVVGTLSVRPISHAAEHCAITACRLRDNGQRCILALVALALARIRAPPM